MSTLLNTNHLAKSANEAMTEHSAQAARLLKNISNEQRLLILCALQQQEMSVGQLNELMPNLSQSALSQHLSLLRKEGLVSTRRDSQTIYYQLSSNEVTRIIHLLHEIYCSEQCQ